MREIPLSGSKAAGRVALVDDEDYDLVMQYRWRVWEKDHEGARTNGPYAQANTYRDGRKGHVFMHKLVTSWPRVDHKNHNGLDNRRSNLRPATTAQNNHNQRPQIGTSSRYKGVTWHKANRKWQATIKLAGRSRYLGCYSTEEDAALAYNAAALEAYGEHAYLNEVAA